MDYLALVLTKIYNLTVYIPKWALFIVSGGIGSIIIGLLHRSPSGPKVEKKAEPVAEPVKPPASPAPGQNLKRAGTKQRKTAKK
jgi:hypothetical protein